jgi:PAS domain S-box-containing protein
MKDVSRPAQDRKDVHDDQDAKEWSKDQVSDRAYAEQDHFFDLNPGMLGIATAEGRFVRVNAAWTRVLGWSSTELTSQPIVNFLHPDDLDAVLAASSTWRGKSYTTEIVSRFRACDGSYHWLEWHSAYRTDGYTYVAVQDVTQRVENERLLRESEERYRLLIDLAPFMIVVHEQGRIIFVNPAGVQMVGAGSADELLGRSLLEFIPQDGQEFARERLLELRHAQSLPRAEQKIICKDGSERQFEVSSIVMPFGGRRATLVFAIDITDRKVAEAERAKLEARLRQSQKLEAIGRLAGGVAHDFNNLLTVILGCGDALANRRELDADDQADLQGISDAARRAATLTRQLLAFSRQQVLQPRIIDVRETVSQATRMLRRVLSEDIELSLHLEAEPLLVYADPGQLEQALVNLAVNARDAMPAGGALTIYISKEVLDAAFVELHPDASPGTYAHIAVTDTGRGMDDSTRAHVFEPFFSTKAEVGLGLGLATVYGIVRQSNGYIWVRSAPGAGTSFEIYLPLTVAAPVDRSKPSTRESAKSAETILLVEDEDEVRNVLKKVLDKAGYHVLVAANGEQALRLATEYSSRIHLLLTDVVMPKMTGRQLADRLCQLRTNIHVLYMSGYAPDAIVSQGVLGEEIHFIQKPLLPSQLLAKVRAVLDGG